MEKASTRRLALLAAAILAAAVLPAGGAGAAGHVRMVAEGLDNPRGLAFAPNGALYVAEAGRGGDGPCAESPEGGEDVCLGDTGAITRIDRKGQARVVTGLPSLADSSGGGAIGPHDVSFHGHGNATVSIGLGQHPPARDELGPDAAMLGTIRRLQPNGKTSHIADLVEHERTDPDGAGADSNPYGLMQTQRTRYVTDAGGNTLVEVDKKGGMSTVAVFPPRMVPAPWGGMMPMQAVPTAVAQGPDGALYVGQLTGFPFPHGEARVFRVAADGTVETAADGFTNIIDVAFGPDGSLYVLEISHAGLLSGSLGGALHRIAPDGAREMLAGPETLFAPGGVAIGGDGAFYVTVCSVCPGGGGVLRIAG